VNAAEFDRNHLWHYRARMPEIVDGDSTRLLTDNGYYIRAEPNIRIADLFAPEAWQPGGRDATERLRRALHDYTSARRWPLRVISRQRETVVSEVKSFDRYVSDIFVVMPDEELVNVRELIAEG